MVPFTSRYFIGSVIYASFLSILSVGRVVNERIAYGPRRKVDLNEEVIVITGAASGLGLLIAQIYGLRGVSVAILDVKGKANEKTGDSDGDASSPSSRLEGLEGIEGVEYYHCDVGKRDEVEEVIQRIEKEVNCYCFCPNIYGDAR